MIEYRKADIADAELLISIYNSAFYSDYIKYGECPAYGKTKEMMEKSILNYPKFIILYDSKPVGCVSFQKVEVGIYEVGCLCVIPEYQGKGIGSKLINVALESARRLGYKSVIVLGHDKYYPKFGFVPASKYGIKAPFDVPDEAFMVKELNDGSLIGVSGIVEYTKEFFE